MSLRAYAAASAPALDAASAVTGQALWPQEQPGDVAAAVPSEVYTSRQSSGSAAVPRDDATFSQQMRRALAVSPDNAMDFTFQAEVSDATG